MERPKGPFSRILKSLSGFPDPDREGREALDTARQIAADVIKSGFSEGVVISYGTGGTQVTVEFDRCGVKSARIINSSATKEEKLN